MKCHPNRPDYYLYQKDGVWFKTDEQLTKLINSRIFDFKKVELPKIEFYPNWNAQGAQNAKYTAWKVNKFGEQVVRWYWKVNEHSKKHSLCSKIGEGRCAVKVPAVIEWSSVAGYWALEKAQYKANEAEAKILDNGGRYGD